MDNILYETGIVPVVKLTETDKAERLAQALCEGGIYAAEVTFRAKDADVVIRRMRAAYPDMAVGAGTVLTAEEAGKAADAGAQFIVSPGFDEDIVAFAVSRGIPVYQGCVTPTEIQKALKMGLHTIKFFPAEQYGGISTIKALSGPFPGVRFMPTGGISLDNLGDYLKLKNVVACGGSFMVKETLIQNNQWDEITALCRKAREIVMEVRG